MEWKLRILGVVVLLLLPLAGCDDSEPAATDGGTDTDTGTDANANCDGGMGDCGAPWGWYDEATGLCWELTPGDSVAVQDDAVAICASSSSGGHCNWRIPTISELRSALRGCEETMTGGVCGVTDECFDEDDCWTEEACYPQCDTGGPGTGGCLWDAAIIGDCGAGQQYRSFWSSSHSGSAVWRVHFGSGAIDSWDDMEAAARPWCVRTGP